MRLSRLIFVAVLLVLALPALAVGANTSSADAPHLHVQLVLPQDQLYPGGPNQAGLYFKLDPGWHVYWKNPGDAGEPPHINWTLPAGVSASPLEFPAPKRLPLGPLMDFGYEDEVLYPLTFTVAPTVKNGPAIIDAQVDWLVCSDRCIPGKAEIKATLDLTSTQPPVVVGAGQDAELMRRLAGTLPMPMPASGKAFFQPTAQGFRLGIVTGRREPTAAFFPADQNILSNPAPQQATPTANGVVLELTKDSSLAANPAQLNGVLELSGGRSYDVVALPGAVAIPSTLSFAQLFQSAALAFLGGLLLNLMPCVFPVLFLKGLALVNSGNEERGKLRAHGFIYAAGIVVSFWILVAVLLGLRAAGATLGWGFQFQSPVFLALMAGLLFFLGLSLAGQFEIGLTLTSAGGSLAQKQGYTGSFFTGVLAVIVATPCTAPFMGAAVGYALAQPALVTFAIFTALALGLALPYVALTLQPAWTRLLPKPGAWMEILRQAISVPLFLTVIWLAWVLAQAYGAAVVAALLCSLLLLAIAGWFLGRWPAQHWSTITAVLIVLAAILLSICAPAKLEAVPQAESQAATQPGAKWEPWSPDALSRAQAQGRPVFVDFTASWCLSCQVNERVALSRPDVQAAFAAHNVVLLKADWTRHDSAITDTLATLNRSGVPAYALYAPGQADPQMLPEVLTPGIVTDALNKLPRP